MVQFTREIRNGKIIANVITDHPEEIKTTRQKMVLLQPRKTKYERQFEAFIDALEWNWKKYGGGSTPSPEGEIQWSKTQEEGH